MNEEIIKEKIYEDKEDLNIHEEIPNKNKVTAQDMNNIKQCLIEGVYIGTCTDEELQEAIVDTSIMNEVLETVDGNIYVPRAWLNLIYPIGRGFIDFTNTDYSNYLGFTWERELVGLTPVGCDATGSNIGTTMGNATHTHTQGATGSTTLTVNQIPSHTHSLSRQPLSYDGKTGAIKGLENGGNWAQGIDLLKTIGNTGGGQGHTHTNPNTAAASSYQPSKVVAYWKRVA